MFLAILLLAACSKEKPAPKRDTGSTAPPPPRVEHDAGPMQQADPIHPETVPDAGAAAQVTPDAGAKPIPKGNHKHKPDAGQQVAKVPDAGPPEPELPSGVQWRAKGKSGDYGFVLKADAPKPIATGDTAHYTLEVTPADGRKINWCEKGEPECDTFPVSLVLEPPDGMKVAKKEITLADVTIDKKHILIDIPVTGTKAGAYTMKGTFKFAVCTEDECEPKRLDMAFLLGVK